MSKNIFLEGVLAPLFLWLFFTTCHALADTAFDPILVNDGIMPPKEVQKLTQMGGELYEKTRVPVFLAAVADLNSTRPIDLIEKIKQQYSTWILLYFSKVPTTVNIFSSDDARNLADFDQILSPLPWRGTIKPVMSPAFSKNEDVKLEVAILNGYADLIDQVAESKGVSLKSSIGSGSRDTFMLIRWLFYGILVLVIFQYFYYMRKKRG
ncbi:hypothetical protein [Hydrogenimonas sp.]